MPIAPALRALIQQKADVNAAEADGTTALHWAAYRDDLESVDLLIRAGANVNAANDLGATPLWNASMNGSAPIVRRLLDAGAESQPGAARRRDAADGRRRDRARPTSSTLLLAKGADANAARRARPDRVDVGGGAAASGRRQAAARDGADVHARSRTCGAR